MLKNRLALLMSGLALIGWGTFVYNAHSSAGAQHELRVQVADLIAAQERLIAEHDQRTADNLNVAREALSNLRASSERTATERDDVLAQLAAAREEMTTLEKRLGEVQPRQTGSVRSVTPPARTTPPPPTRMSGDRLKPSL
jgi:septal ring factor EnvC (AmiA/AmiB activator)